MHEFSTLVELLRYRAQHDPDRTAYIFLRDGEVESEVMTYLELDRRARAIAAKLQSLGAEGQRALLLYSPNLHFVTAFLGCLYAKVLAVPAYPPRPNATMTRLRAMMSDAGATMALTTQQLLGNMGKLLSKNPDFAQLQWVTTDGLADDTTADWASSWSPPSLTPDFLAFLQYTSGSTGLPKGVMVSHGNLLQNAKAINERFGDTDKSVCVSWLPPYHDMGLMGGVLQPIYIKMPGILMAPVSFLQRPFRWLKSISTYGGTTSGGPNFAYDLCLKQVTPEQRAELDLSRWSLAFSGAEPVRAETVQQFTEYFAPCGFRPEAFFPCYGMAEATLFITGIKRDQTPTCATFKGESLEQNTVVPVVPSAAAAADQAGDQTGELRQLIGCGLSSSSQQVKIVNPTTLEACAELEVGEIWAAGPNIAQGYWNRPQQTEEAFNATVAKTGEGPFLRTGDLGFVQDGELFVTGRLKDLIVIRGLNHYPQDIEATMGAAHPQIRSGQAAAFSVDIKENGVREERLVVVQEMERTALRRLKKDDVITAIRQAIAQHHSLQVYAVLLLKTGSIPKTSSGKIQRHACKKGFLDDSLTVVGKWTESDTGSTPSNAPSSATSAATPSPSPTSPLAASLSAFPFVESTRRRLRIPQTGAIASIQTWLVNQVARMLKIAPDMIDIHEPLARYGLDSIAAVRLSGALEDWLGRSLSPTLAYDYPSIAALSKYLSADSEELAPETEDVREPSQYRRRTSDEAIAIVGMGCRFPGANNPDEFWQLLKDGRDAITTLDDGDRWSGHLSAKVGGFLQQKVDEFDPQFFGISPREANRMDPQQRLLLEVSWEALEQAGIAPNHLAGTATGVFVGISSNDYAQLQAREMATDPYSGTGNAHSIVANRLSYVLDLRGPSLAVDTACSSSLVALHTATRSLQQGDCDQAIAAGVNLILAPDLTLTFADAGMLAADRRCKTFSAAADGYVRGEGCGAVILKRLSDAQRDGDTVLAVIKGSAINQDGRSNGLTAPNGLAQQAVIQAALRRAEISAADIQYVDAHGTGTVLGDPIELNALSAVLAQGRDAGNARCWIGSVKTNIGHLEAAAGMASLIKVILAFQHGEIPPHLHAADLNPHVSWDSGPLTVATDTQSWQRGDARLAGISSFGFGGTNAHVILADDPAPPDESGPSQSNASLGSRSSEDRSSGIKQAGGLRPPTKLTQQATSHHLLTLSAKTPSALTDLVKAYDAFLEHHPHEDLGSICATAHLGRSHFPHRLAIIAESNLHLQQQLQSYGDQSSPTCIAGEVTPGTSEKLAFLFTGQGSQYQNMGYDLYQSQPVFRRVIDECDRILQTHLEYSLLHVLYPEERRKRGDERPLPEGLIHQTRYTQPALFAVEYALAELWQSWGVYPDVVMGHSVGEYVAACVAGIFSLEDGLKLIAGRSRLMQNLPANGAMVAVFASAQHITETVDSYSTTHGPIAVDIAAVNGPESTVISGEKRAIATIVKVLNDQGLTTKPLQVSHAFHSSLMTPILNSFEAIAQTITLNSPQLPIVSNVTGTLFTPDLAEGGSDGPLNPMVTPAYWSRHIRQSVQFAPSMTTLFEAGYNTFLEVGPKPILLGMAQRCLSTTTNTANVQPNALQWLHSLRANQSDWSVLFKTAAQLYVQGHSLNWNGIAAGHPVQRLHHLPTYPWQRQRCWFTAAWDAQPLGMAKEASAAADIHTPMLGSPGLFYGIEWRSQPLPLVIPASGVPASDSTLGSSNGAATMQAPLPEHWVIATPTLEPSPLANQVVNALNAQGQRVWTIGIGDRAVEDVKAEMEAIQAPIHRVLLIAASEDNGDGITSLTQPCQSALTAVQALIQFSQSNAIQGSASSDSGLSPVLWIVTQNATVVDHKTEAESALAQAPLAQSSLWGLGKVIALEHPDLWGGLIDLDSQQGSSQQGNPQAMSEDVLTALIAECGQTTGERAIAFHHNQRYVQRLVPLSSLNGEARKNGEPKQGVQRTQSPEHTYLITGGLGSLGLAVAQELVQQHGISHLTLIGRREPSTAAQQAIARLQKQGATLHIAQADIAQASEVTHLLQQLQTQGLVLKGIVHAAGVLQDGLLHNQTWDTFSTVLAPKVHGAWHLHHLTQSYELDCFILFSSVASLLGSPGQGNYAAANAFMDALAQHRQQRGLPALSINWGPWNKGGMATGVGDALQDRLTRSGFRLLEPEQGLTAMSRLLGGASQPGLAQVGVMDVDWAQMEQRLTPAQRTFLSPVLETVDLAADLQTATAQPQPSTLIDQVLEKTESDRPAFFTTYLHRQISQVLQVPEQTLSGSSNLMDMGMDSLMVMEAINQLRQDFDLMLYPREFYEHPTLDTLSGYLAQEFTRLHANAEDMASGDKAPVVIPTLQGTSDTVTQHQGSSLPPALFILSSPRSGSTLLRVMLAGHSRLFAAPELHLLPFDRMAERQERLGDSHLSEGLERSLMELNHWDNSASRTHVQQWLDRNVPVADVYAALQAMAQGRTVVDKSPTYAMHRPTLDRAEALFQNAKYIHLVRHPYSVVESFVRMRMDKLLGIPAGNPYELAERIWTQSNQNILDFAQTVGPDRVHLVQYEELVRDPAATLRTICQFLDLDLEDALLNPYDGDRMTDGVYDTSLSLGDPNFLLHQQIDSSLADAWKTIDLPHTLGAQGRAIAQTLSYTLPHDQEPSLGVLPSTQPTPEPEDSRSVLASTQPTPESMAVIAATEHSLTLNGLTHTLCTWGDEDAPPVVCLHGVLDQGMIWHPVAQSLAQQGYRVIAPDLRGHGRSSHVGPGGSYHLLDFLSDIDAIINHLYPLEPTPSPSREGEPTPSPSREGDRTGQNLKSKIQNPPTPSPSQEGEPTPSPFQEGDRTGQNPKSKIQNQIVLVGHSMGSIIAALYASSRPERVRSLFMVETILPGEKRTEVRDQLTTLLNAHPSTPAHPIFPDVETAARRLRQGTPSLSESFSLELAERICTAADGDAGVQWSWDPKLRNRTGIGFSRMPFGRSDYLKLLKELSVPVTLVYGDRSTFNRSEDLAAQSDALSHAQRVVLSGGHNIHLDASSELTQAIATQLNQ